MKFATTWSLALLGLLGGVGAAFTETAKPISVMRAAYRRPTSIPAPAANPQTPAKIALGMALFFDPRLSGSGVIACSSCHNPSLGWQDGLAKGRGHMGAQLGRHTPTILNAAWTEPMFWDGRAKNAEEQAKGPIQAEKEMNMPAGDAVKAVAAIEGYRSQFEKVYPGEGITIDTIAKAIASYERTVVSGKAPFDKWIAGDPKAISADAKAGFVLFNGKAKCSVCHKGWRFTDDGFHDIGLKDEDLGRGGLTKVDFLNHAFKTPTLRNIAERPPYMHDGSVATLEAVVEHYNGGFAHRATLDLAMVPLNLSDQEKKQLVAFMTTLTSADAPVTAPVLPR